MTEVRHVRISDICVIEKGTTGLAKAVPGSYPLVTTGAECRTSKSYQFDSKAVCIPLVSSTGHGKKSLNYVHYQDGKFALGSILAAVIPKDDGVVNARYLHVYLQKNKDRVIVPLMRGAANVSLSIKAISNIEIPLPSLRKQEKTLKKIDSVSEEHADFQQELNVQTGFFKRLRQQTLQEAIEGKLTAEWRKNNPKLISGDNHASKLLEKIKAEKERLVKEKKIKKQKSLAPITDAEKPFDLLEEWTWCRVGGISSYGQSLKIAPQNIKDNVWVLELEDIEKTSSRLLQKIKFKERKSKSTKSIFRKGDVLYGKLRPYLDKVIVANEDGVCTTEIMPISLVGALNPWFIRYSLKRGDFLIYVNSQVSGMRMPRLKTESGRNALIPLPPLPEQQAIVERVDKLMTMIDKLEKQVTERKEQSQMLMQSVLKEAFES